MILKSLLFSFALFSLYSLCTYSIFPHWSVSQHQWQENLVKAERYLYEEHDIESIIVGTSLSCRLIMDSLPKTYNLSLGGQSVLDGLNVLRKKTTLPRKLYIESNFINKGVTNSFLSSVNNPLLSPIKGVLNSVREDKQPIAVLGDVVKYKLMDPLLSKFKRDNLKRASVGKTDQDVFCELLEDQVKTYQTTPAPELIVQRFNDLEREINYFKGKGVEIIFFEMPVNGKLVNLPMAQILRKELHKRFPQDKHIPLPDCSQYSTIDGVHLTSEEAIRYTKYFKLSNSTTSITLMGAL